MENPQEYLALTFYLHIFSVLGFFENLSLRNLHLNNSYSTSGCIIYGRNINYEISQFYFATNYLQ